MISKELNILTLIPARGDSKGIPFKNIINFCGKPLIVWSIEQAKNSKYINDVYVSSDDSNILRISKRAGAKIIIRPKKLATDKSLSEDALKHALSYIRNDVNYRIDAIVFLQATSPLRTSHDIDNALETFFLKKADSLFSATVLDDFCVWGIKNKRLRSLTYNYKERGRRQDRKPYYLENGSIYIFKPEVLEKYNNRLGGKICLYLMEQWKSYEIDKKEDIELCSYFMKRCQIKKSKK